MKVIYEDPIIKRIQQAVSDADMSGRRIGYIEVTIREANELSEYIQRSLWVKEDTTFRHYTRADAGKLVGHFYGAEIRVEGEPK